MHTLSKLYYQRKYEIKLTTFSIEFSAENYKNHCRNIFTQ